MSGSPRSRAASPRPCRLTRELDPALLDIMLAERWPTKDRALMRSVVDTLASSEVWQTVAIDPDASDRWMRILTEEGMISAPPGVRAGPG